MAMEATWRANLRVRLRRLRFSQNMRPLARHGKGVKLPLESLPGRFPFRSRETAVANAPEGSALNRTQPKRPIFWSCV